LRHDRSRPLLQTVDPRRRLAELHAERDPLYREVATIIVDSGSQSLRTLARVVEARLVEHYAACGAGEERAGPDHEPRQT
jgi:shikimate kinase